ncbi:MAG TPA: PAS domain S-box protein, partial [Ktedonobacteraceae bacterium]|nr:PAS domain S-box protein [Ktedonobacteraceae bacterium]
MATIPDSGNQDESLPEQDEVRRAKQRFQAMFDLADVGMAHVALDGRFLQVNQKLCDIVGYTSDEMLEHTFQDITAPADLKATLVQMEQLLAGEFTTSTMEKRYLRADGSTIWNNLTVSLVRDQQGNPDYFISVIEDISERKAIEEAFQREQQAFQRIAENAEDIITRFDRSLQHLYVNPAITVATGQAPEMFIGKTNEDLGMSAEQVMLWNAKLNGVLDTGEPDSLEFSFPSPTGLRYYHSRLTAERDSQGEIVSVLSIARDVTDLKQAQFALIQSEARARRLIDSNFIGVGIADVNGIFEANDALLEMVGYTRAELAAGGIDWPAMTPPEFISRDEFGLQELRERGICTPYQKEYLHRDGSRVAILVGAATIQADPLQWVCFILDITERHRPELSLQQSLNALLMVAEALVTSEEPSDDSGQVKESPEDVARRVLTPIVEVLSCEGVLMVKLRPASDIIDTLVMVGIEEFDEPALLEQMRGQSLSSRFESPAYFKQLEAGEVVKQAVDIWTYPGRQPTARLGRSVLIPIRLGEDLLGLLTLYPKAGRARYTKEEGLLAAAMAKLAALLIERERLQHDREEAWVRMQAAQEVMQQMDEFLGIASHELKT